MSSRRQAGEPFTGETIPINEQPRPAARRPETARPRGPIRPPLQPAVRRRPSIGVVVRRIAVVLAILLVACLVGVIVFQQRVAGKVRMDDARANRPPPSPLLAPSNILLLGVDLRRNNPEEGVRSDTLMLLHLDLIGGWASVLSVPRDSLVDIPGYGEGKITTAFARAYENTPDGADGTAFGAALAADTVEQFLGLRERGERIDYVATVDFDGFAAMIDAVGGIEVEVPFEIEDTEYPTEDFGYTTITIPAGPQVMDGERALQYVRTRHADSDFGRAQRQQQVVSAIVQRLRSQPLLLRPLSALRLVDAAGGTMRTSLPVGRPDALLMGGLLARIDPEQLGQYRISPDSVGMQEFGSDIVWDPAGVQAVVQEALSPPGEAREAAVVQVLNGTGVGGIAGQVSDRLAEQKFEVAAAGNAEPVERSVIYDYGSHPLTRRRLSRSLADMPIEQRPAGEAPGANLVVVLGADYAQYWTAP